MDLGDAYDLGGEFFRWEFATAVAGAVLGINPFDQPDVQGAKDATDRMMEHYLEKGSLPAVDASDDLRALLEGARPGDYLAVAAYIPEGPSVRDAFDDLRRRVMDRYGIATTVGYGPRYLHSTGQLHKGGPNTALCLQVAAESEADLPVPGEPYSFGVLARSQALGDLQALEAAGRRVVRASLGDDPAAGIRRLAGLAA